MGKATLSYGAKCEFDSHSHYQVLCVSLELTKEYVLEQIRRSAQFNIPVVDKLPDRKKLFTLSHTILYGSVPNGIEPVLNLKGIKSGRLSGKKENKSNIPKGK